MINLKDEIKFPCGLSMKNRFMLAPLTNTQSHENGILSEDEFNWLTMRAKGILDLPCLVLLMFNLLVKVFLVN